MMVAGTVRLVTVERPTGVVTVVERVVESRLEVPVPVPGIVTSAPALLHDTEYAVKNVSIYGK